MKILYTIVLSLMLSIIISSCGKKQTIIYNQPELISDTGYYQRAWVDPKMVYSDSLITIIRSERVDSFLVEKKESDYNQNIITLAFEIKDQTCFTSVLLLDASGQLLSILAADDLTYGHYKVSLNKSRITFMQPDARRFFLKTDFCGFSVVEEIVL